MQRDRTDLTHEPGATATESRINGLDIEALNDLVDSVPGRFTDGPHSFAAHSRWLDGTHTRTTVNGISVAGGEPHARLRPFVLESDLPPLFLGGDRGMDPLELLLAAISASLTTTLVWHASVLGIHLDAVDVRVEGDIDLAGCLGNRETTSTGYQQIRVTVRMEADASHAALNGLLTTAVRLSPVINTVGQGASIKIDSVVATKPEWRPSRSQRAGDFR